MKYNPSVLRKIFFLICIAFVAKTHAQNSDFIVSMTGMGTLKIGMSQSEVEKMLHQKLVLKNALDTAISWQDSTTVKYKNSNIILFFQRHYTADNIYYMYLIGLKTSSSLFKTASGIGIGDDKLKIIAAYEADYIFMGPEFEEEAFTKNSKTGYIISISNNDRDRHFVFYLRNKKVVAIEVKTIFNDEE